MLRTGKSSNLNKSIWKKALRMFTFLLGAETNFSLENRIYFLVLLLTILTTAVASTIGFLLSQEFFLIIFGMLCVIALIYLFYISRFKGRSKQTIPFFSFLVFIILPLAWIFNEGSKGPVPAMIPFGSMVIVLINPAKIRKYLIILLGALFGALFALEIFFPNAITAYASNEDRLIDSILLIGFLIFPALIGLNIFIVDNYSKAHAEAEFERKRSDQLLYNILPSNVADELRIHGKYSPSFHESVSILFTDFIGFTKMAEGLSPSTLLLELDEIFFHFDRIATSHNLERIKTIGDAYMAVAGLSSKDTNHAKNAVACAIDMIHYLDSRNSNGKLVWKMRSGIHSGPVVAGVIGNRNLAFDIWGDTVNIASRIESSGESGKINVSKVSKELCGDSYTFVSRGFIEIKNKSAIEMFFIK